MDNPYQPPASLVAAPPDPELLVHDLASGQKFAIYAILLYFAMLALRAFIGPAALLLFAVCLILAPIGIYRICRGLGYRMWSRILIIVLSMIPLLGILILLRLSSSATAGLRAAGYSVGLLGAKNIHK